MPPSTTCLNYLNSEFKNSNTVVNLENSDYYPTGYMTEVNFGIVFPPTELPSFKFVFIEVAVS